MRDTNATATNRNTEGTTTMTTDWTVIFATFNLAGLREILTTVDSAGRHWIGNMSERETTALIDGGLAEWSMPEEDECPAGSEFVELTAMGEDYLARLSR